VPVASYCFFYLSARDGLAEGMRKNSSVTIGILVPGRPVLEAFGLQWCNRMTPPTENWMFKASALYSTAPAHCSGAPYGIGRLPEALAGSWV
jgi:hypothetical protein